MTTTNTPTYEQLIAAGLDPAQIERPIAFAYWKCAHLYNPNYPDRINKELGFVKRLKGHYDIKPGWEKAWPIMDPTIDWGLRGEVPWYPVAYQMEYHSADADPEILYIGKADCWARGRVPDLRRTFRDNVQYDSYRVMTPEEQEKYPRENLYISWLGCFDHFVSQVAEAYLLNQYEKQHDGQRPLINIDPAFLNADKLKWWTDNTDIANAIQRGRLDDISWMEHQLVWRRSEIRIRRK